MFAALKARLSETYSKSAALSESQLSDSVSAAANKMKAMSESLSNLDATKQLVHVSNFIRNHAKGITPKSLDESKAYDKLVNKKMFMSLLVIY